MSHVYEVEIKNLYKKIKPEIETRIAEFRKIWEAADREKLFIELAFCLFTPQSSAKSCWRAMEILLKKDLVFEGSYDQIREDLNLVRFRNNKSKYLIEAREKFINQTDRSMKQILSEFDSVIEMREWLVENVKGIGYKEASHYLRNIGMGDNIAILDRHILKNMKLLGVIDEIPKTLSFKVYHDLEDKLRKYSKKIKIPMDHLDFVLWYKEAGEVFK